MNISEQADFIDHFLKALYDASFPTSLAEGLEMKQMASKQNREKFKTLEYVLEELDLVELVRGRDNSTIDGQCEYFISHKGRELVENDISSLQLLIEREVKNDLGSSFTENQIKDGISKILDKRIEQASFFLSVVASENILNINYETLKIFFKKWLEENSDFDLQVKNGDLAIEDRDLQIVPDFKKEDISQFIHWATNKKADFINFLKSQGVMIKPAPTTDSTINNSGNMIINNNSNANNQSISTGTKNEESSWAKANVIIALVVGIATIAGIIISLIKS